MDATFPRLERHWLTPTIRPTWGNDSAVRENVLWLAAGETDPMRDPSILLHDMAHLVEIPIRRALLLNFGMKTNRHPRTTQAIERECRTLAIALRIGESLGWNKRRLAMERVQWEGSFVANQRDGHLAPGDSDEWVHRKVEQSLTRWPIIRVRAEWWRKAWYVERTLRATSRGHGR